VYDPTTLEPMQYQTPEDEFRALMGGDHPRLRRSRALLARLPSGPRCKTCNAPFGFPGSLVSRAMGRQRFPKNPRFCQVCFNWLTVAGIRGADVELSVLFGDVRDSVGLAERLGPAAYTALIDRFYKVASNAVIIANGIADRFVGDAVIGLFVPGMTGPDHTGAALTAARAIVEGTGHPSDPWIAAGVAVHRGVAFLGGVGEEGQLHDFTALGDPVNTAARLASAAGAGEILVTLAAAASTELDEGGLERRSLELKGKTQPLDVVVVTSTTTA
jgi:adenylate cyclase